jgi:hypothetical protein
MHRAHARPGREFCLVAEGPLHVQLQRNSDSLRCGPPPPPPLGQQGRHSLWPRRGEHTVHRERARRLCEARGGVDNDAQRRTQKTK